jgi:hypothetical protein
MGASWLAKCRAVPARKRFLTQKAPEIDGCCLAPLGPAVGGAEVAPGAALS